MSPGTRRSFTGQVISNKMAKTVVVAITWQQTHRLYRKAVRRITKAYAHDEGNQCRVGDQVRIEETRPLSRLKRWRVVEVLARRDLPDVSPAALDQQVLEAMASGAQPAPTPTAGGTQEAQGSGSPPGQGTEPV
ncbi:MAG: 30S ribosomal protein S17 [Dehalococcoidia bacterium]|nr:30S ribosomal protein S17 [Dehalococcoidia bacterium]